MSLKKRSRLDLDMDPLSVGAVVTSNSGSASFGGQVQSQCQSQSQSLFLSSTNGVVNNLSNTAGAQIFLTICGDENSEEDEYYAIKQEPDLDVHTLLPTNLQLPTGCEIYLVKDTAQVSSPTQLAPNPSTIKLEPDSIADNCNLNVKKLLFVSGQVAGTTTATTTPTLATSTTMSHSILVENHQATQSTLPPITGTVQSQTQPHQHQQNQQLHSSTQSSSSQLQSNVKVDLAYKKRDDKRRATHNEVERRRRDKINCWIFKLKEMLPTEGNRYKPNTQMDEATSSSSSISQKSSQTNQNGRTPPNDSKSQILIKACDYIKSMQNEIDNLRECLRESDNLRLSNQALRDELDSLRQQQELRQRYHGTTSSAGNGGASGGSFNVTLNSLNSSATSDLFEGIDTTATLATVSSINFTKRGLLISDYDE
ncbi:uncharacterized protein Dwil_GK26764 [Drosophila willistoni]|uniref:BHLH domain-containing protein n=1 Tax=Drosophila willistoni TaxID=7260 RepID=A0A0Q9WWC3_DROWI|nr:uncharacterized protein LOC26528766 [Drosophila willistoni]KRG00374.1 uncharacterized protein Dwil_GK26764 [Drosophila willistoni]